jgi:hypothetical protein
MMLGFGHCKQDRTATCSWLSLMPLLKWKYPVHVHVINTLIIKFQVWVFAAAAANTRHAMAAAHAT